MVEIKFYRGLSSKYSITQHGNGIYFATDTHEILHNGVSFGESEINLDNYATINFVEDSLAGTIKELSYDPSTGIFSYKKRVGFSGEDHSYDTITFSLPTASSENMGLMSSQDKLSLDELLISMSWNEGEED